MSQMLRVRNDMTCAVGIVAALFLGGAADAQTFTAGVRGAVRESGGIVPGVTVELV